MPVELPWDVLPATAFAADVATRRDAANGFVVSERDYVSSWLTTTRNMWRMLGGESVCMTLEGAIEQKMGCDGVFVIASKNIYKYFFFESKVYKNYFDSTKAASPEAILQYPYLVGQDISRFSDQLARQSEWLKTHVDDVIVEIFLHLDDYGKPTGNFQEMCSSIFKHLDVRNEVDPPGGRPADVTWKLADVDAFCSTNPSENIEMLLDKLTKCLIGKPNRFSSSPAGYDDGFPFLPSNQALVHELRNLGLYHYAYFEGKELLFDVDENKKEERF